MGHEVDVFEKSRAGGLASGFLFPGLKDVYLDRFYHHIFRGDDDIRGLIDEYNLTNDLMWLPSRTGLFARGRTWPFLSPRDMLAFSPLGGLSQRFTMCLSLLSLKLSNNWHGLDNVSCKDFFAKRFNKAGYRNLWEPLIRQKFGAACRDIPAAFLWGRINPRAGSRKNGQEVLGYLRGGFQRLILAMVNGIKERQGRIHEHTPIEKLVPGPKPKVITSAGSASFDLLIFTLALQFLPQFVTDLGSDIREKALAIEDVAATCFVLVMKRQLGEFYWLNNIDPEVNFGIAVEHTNLVPPEHYGGSHVLYVCNYHYPRTGLSRPDPRYLLDQYAPSLKRVYPSFREEDVLHSLAFRAMNSTPLYNLKFADRMPPYRGWLEKIDICNMAQVYPIDRNMNNCVANALRYVREYGVA